MENITKGSTGKTHTILIIIADTTKKVCPGHRLVESKLKFPCVNISSVKI